MPIAYGDTPITSVSRGATAIASAALERLGFPGQTATVFSAISPPDAPTNVAIAVEEDYAAPSQTTGLAVDSTGDGTIDLSWTAPASDAAITDYRVEYTPSGGSATEVLVGSAATSYQLTGLTNDTEYSVRVAAISAGGQGDYSAVVTGTPSAQTGWDISTASYVQAFSVEGQERFPQGVFFKPDGLKMYVAGKDGNDINEYTLGTAWDISSASYAQSFSVSGQGAGPKDVFFKPDGLKMYVVDDSIAGRNVNEYNIGTAWDISSASYAQAFTVYYQESAPRGVFFKPDGLKMYVTGSNGREINEYTLGIAWDISSASYAQNFSVSAQESAPQGVFFKPDGLRMYVVGDSGDAINEYALGIAWDISSASYAQNFSVSAQESAPQGVFFKTDGLRMYVAGDSGRSVYEYSL